MKKLLFFSTLFLPSAVAFPQLFVRPATSGTNTNSFVYVKNEIIYVKEDVNLEKNAAGDTEASIYLRNQGQLIQGGTTSINKGNGFLSVQQNTKPTNAFAYYYWCSPVGNPTLATSGNTNFGLGSIYEDKNSIVGEGTKASLSANIAGRDGFSSPLTISRRWVYTHPTPGTEAAGDYIRINATDGAAPGFGFTMKGVNQGTAGSNTANITLDQTYEFRGRPNNGDFVIPVAGPSSGGDPQMTLTGNPYPSALDLQAVFEESGNDDLDAIYFYDEDRTVMSHLYSQKPFGYGTWVPGGYTAASFYIWNELGNQGGTVIGTGISANNKRFAPIGQGFMFVGNGSGDSLVTIKNSHRVYVQEGAANNSVFQRPDSNNGDLNASLQSDGQTTASKSVSALPQLENRLPQLRLYVVFDDALTRDLLLLFSPQASDSYDRGFDALSPLGMKSDAYFPITSNNGSRPYVIQGINFDPLKQIPITFKLHKTSRIEVRAVEEIKKLYQKAYLYDSLENTYRPLTKAHSLAGTFTLPAGTYENRFFIVFRAAGFSEDNNSIAGKEQTKLDVSMFQNNPSRQLEIINPKGHTLKSASVYDMSGKLVISENNLGDSTSYSFYTGNLSDGVYLVKLITSDDVIIDYKAMVMNK